MIIPIWANDWEFECCYPDATVGERWEAPLLFDTSPFSWETKSPAVEAPTGAERLGVVALDIRRIRTPERLLLYRHATLSFLARSELSDGRHVGRLWLNAHADHTEIRTVRGTVTRVEVVPLVYELVAERTYTARAALEPRDVRSTLQRNLRSEGSSESSPRHLVPQLLVWLDAD